MTVHLEGRDLGTGGPEMTIHRPDEFFARLGRGVLIGFGEAYLTGAWDAEDLGGFLTVLAADMPTLVPGAAAEAARRWRSLRPPQPPEEHPRELAAQHRPPLRPVQRPVRAVPRPGPELLVGAVRRPSRCDAATTR